MKHLHAQKVGMTQIFAPDGAAIAATLVTVPQHIITQVKAKDTDGYEAVQVGTNIVDEKKAKRVLAKPQRGHLKKVGTMMRRMYEIRSTEAGSATVGQAVTWDVFKAGDLVDIRGTSKGRGFAGVVKRHHFAGGPASHGHKDNLRKPGAIGSGHPQHVIPGTRMAGQMGAAKVMTKNVEVLAIVPDERVVVLKGAVPGPVNGWLELHVTGKTATHPVMARESLEAAAKDGKADAKKGKK